MLFLVAYDAGNWKQPLLEDFDWNNDWSQLWSSWLLWPQSVSTSHQYPMSILTLNV
jgi:hypothetical protein